MAKSSEQTAEQLIALLQRFIRLRPKLMVPEHVVRYKQQMEKLKSTGNPEDRANLFRIFIILAQNENPPTMGELGTELGIPLSSATRIVDWLVGTKMVERVHDPSDRRVVRVQMTEQGQQLFQTAMDYNKQRIANILNNFSTEEKAQLLHLMSKLFDSLLAEK